MYEMGNFIGELFKPDYDREINEFRKGLVDLLRDVDPNDLLGLALEDEEIYDACRHNEDLRQNCIIAAVRKFHLEKFFLEEVHNRTAAYMILLDEFTYLQDEWSRKEYERNNTRLRKAWRRVKSFFFCFPCGDEEDF